MRTVITGILLGFGSVAASAVVEAGGADKLTFHGDPQRTGWNSQERRLTPAAVAGGKFGLVWQSPLLDGFGEVPARLFATPLYVNAVAMTSGRLRGRTLAMVYAVTSTGFAYGINATPGSDPAPGAILWRVKLAEQPCESGEWGNLSTPVIDRAAQRIYVTSCDDAAKWRVHALDIRDGSAAKGWPITIDADALNRPGINRNGANRFDGQRTIIQRGALNLNGDGGRLYIAIGPDSTGWMVAVDTRRAVVATAFSSTASADEDQGGMWGSGGPSIDPQGRVHIATGSKFLARARKGVAGIFPDSAHNWGHSVLQLRDDRAAGFALAGTYSPFNYCQAGSADIDLGAGGTIAVDLPAAATATPHLLVLGGKQGNLYLLDRDRMPGGTVKRQPCATDPDTDGSLLAPEPQPHFGMRGPVNLFGPYSDYVSMLDQAKSRSTPAFFQATDGAAYVFATGSAKSGRDFSLSVPPGLARVRIVTAPGQPAFLRIDALEETQTFQNPGSPVVSSNGGTEAIVWVLDPNVPRSASLYGEDAPRPVLYAFDALSLKLLWKSAPGMLFPTGKYNEATVADGLVLVGTDRIQAFGLGGVKRVAPAAASPARPSASRPAVPTAQASAVQMIVRGRTIYQARCAACHNARQPGTPGRDELRKMPRQRISYAMLTGVMKPMASGMSPADVENVARFLSEGK